MHLLRLLLRITFGQWEGETPINDFQLYIHNLTYYGLDLNGEIVYNHLIPQAEPPDWTFENSTFYEEEGVYSAYTYINVSVHDIMGKEGYSPPWYDFTLTAGVSRRNDVAVTSVGASPKEVFPDEEVSITVNVANQGAINETFNVTTYGNDTVIGTQTVSDLPPGNWTPLTFNWNTSDVKAGDYKIKAHASVVPGEWDTADNTKLNGTVTILTVTIWYMQSDKWSGSSYYRLYWNNTITSTYKTVCKFQYCLYGELGVKIYKGTTCISGANPIYVGSWYNTQSCLKNRTWDCDEYNVTGTYIKIEVYYRFAGDSWQSMGVSFKTETFTENTILNATEWNIYLYGEFQMEWGPLGGKSPPEDKVALTFYWGSSNEESRIENMIFTQE